MDSAQVEEKKEIEIQQFAAKVHHYSSQYGGETSISYTVTNLAGMCNKYPHYGDFTQACVFRTYGPWWQKAPSTTKTFTRIPESFNSIDYVEIYFSEGVIPKSIEIFETYNPGAVVRIMAYVHLRNPALSNAGHCEALWTTLWSGQPERPAPESRIFSPPLKKVPYPTNLLRLELNPVLCDYYTELDGVRLTGIGASYALPELNSDMMCGPPADYETALREYGTPVDPFPFPGTSGYDESPEHGEHVQPDEVHVTDTVDTCKAGKAPHTADSEPGAAAGDGEGTRSCSDTLVQDLSRLHLTDGLVAALEWSDNGYFDMLPGEVIQAVISYLDMVSVCRLGQTCRLLQQHCYDQLQYTELSLQPYWSNICDETLDNLHTRCRSIQRLSLSWCGGCRRITPSGLHRFLEVCGSNLTTLHLACCRFLNDVSMAALASALGKNCPLLEDLDLKSNKTIFTGVAFRDLCQLKRLRRLNLYRTFIDTPSITAIIRGCHDLEYLNLGSCGSINDFDMVAVELSINCKQLKHLDFWRARSLTEIGLLSIVKNCEDLEELDVGWCPNLRSGTGIFVELAKKCPKLKKLFLTANRTICDADLEALSKYCCNLEQLDILGTREVSPRVAEKVLEHCGRLQFLDVSFCSGITTGFVTIWQHVYPRVAIKRSFQT